MTKLGKVLTVFLAVGSLAFAGFALASYAGGPNWEAELKAADLQQYNFAKSEGEVPQWQVTRRFADRAEVGGPTPILAQAILTAREDLQKYQQERIADLDKQINGDEEQGLRNIAESSKKPRHSNRPICRRSTSAILRGTPSKVFEPLRNHHPIAFVPLSSIRSRQSIAVRCSRENASDA